MHAAEMAAVRKAEDTGPEFKCDVDVNAIFGLIGALQEFIRAGKPEELAVEAEMQGQEAAIQNEENVLTFASDAANSAVRSKAGQAEWGLWFHSDGMQNVNGANALFLDQRAQSPYDGFDFGQLGHKRKSESGTRLK